MKILALNTAFKNTQIAISYEEKQFFDCLDESKKSESTLVKIDEMLKQLQININQIQNFAVVIGPGSFTGIRVSLSLVKGFCNANLNSKVIPICSLDLMASEHKSQESFYCILNALGGMVFACKYDCNGQRLCEPFLKEDMDFDAKTVSLENDLSADFVVELTPQGLLDYAKNNIDKAICEDKVELLYLRKSQAEADYDKRNSNK